MALTKITATNLGANAVTANSIGYTPANKAGDTFTGQVRIVKAGNNTTALTPTTAKDFSTKISADGVTNTQGYIFDGIAMGGAGEEYSGIYSYDDGSSAGTGVVLFGGNASAISKGVDVDSLGRVRMSNLPAFYQTGGGYAATKTTGTFSSALGDSVITHLNNGSCLNTTTGRFTAPIAGMYEFTVNCCLAGTAGDIGVAIRKNGSIDLGYQLLYRNVYNGNSVHVKVLLNASDYVDGLIVWNNGSTSNIYASSFTGQLIG